MIEPTIDDAATIRAQLDALLRKCQDLDKGTAGTPSWIFARIGDHLQIAITVADGWLNQPNRFNHS
jgi:hypothetical protein